MYPKPKDGVLFYEDLNMSFRVIPNNMMAKPDKEEMLGREEMDVSMEIYDPVEDTMEPKEFVFQRMNLTNEVKKMGVIIDRGSTMEFRPGDILIVYISMGGFEK